MRADPGLLNRDPYGAGWVARVRPVDWDADRRDMQTGEQGVATYREALVQQGIACKEA